MMNIFLDTSDVENTTKPDSVSKNGWKIFILKHVVFRKMFATRNDATARLTFDALCDVIKHVAK